MFELSERELKNWLYDQLSSLFRALGSPRRYEIVDLLAQGEYTVEKLAAETGMTVANTSQHLQQLRAAKLVAVRRAGNEMHYRLADETIPILLQLAQTIARARLAEVERIFNHLDQERRELTLVPFSTLLQQLQDQVVIVLDVRLESEYSAGHIPGAYSLPLSRLEARFHELPLGLPVVAYCRGYYSTLSDQAVRFLNAQGVNASRLETGFLEWKAQGLPVEKGPGVERIVPQKAAE